MWATDPKATHCGAISPKLLCATHNLGSTHGAHRPVSPLHLCMKPLLLAAHTTQESPHIPLPATLGAHLQHTAEAAWFLPLLLYSMCRPAPPPTTCVFHAACAAPLLGAGARARNWRREESSANPAYYGCKSSDSQAVVCGLYAAWEPTVTQLCSI